MTEIAPIDSRLAAMAARLLTEGGDARIRVDPETGRNQYMSSPVPVSTIAYASSTANDISAGAFARVCERLAEIAPDGLLSAEGYAVALDGLRARILAAYGIAGERADVMFAASGTDLEYLGLAMAKGKGAGGIRTILLGADEVGSGCIYSARGQFFASETARGVAVEKGAAIGGNLPATVEMVSIPVRDDGGHAVSAVAMAAAIDAEVSEAAAAGRHVLVHVVHGSKTGLVLPNFEHIDALKARHGDAIGFIVDACQARITSEAVAAYLDRGCAVMLTGSKFMGGPPFNGFAIVPKAIIAAAAELPSGFAAIFRRAEWPQDWPGALQLAAEPNLGLLLRLEASVFELERFQAIPIERVERVVLAFHAAVRATFVDRLGGRRIAPYALGEKAEGDAHPIEMRTLSTIDLSGLSRSQAKAADMADAPAMTFDEAAGLHAALVARGVRLGQPVKCVKLPNGRWGATVRVGLSMAQVVTFDAMDDAAMADRFAAELGAIVAEIEAVQAI